MGVLVRLNLARSHRPEWQAERCAGWFYYWPRPVRQSLTCYSMIRWTEAQRRPVE
jgi:hypothetical protein